MTEARPVPLSASVMVSRREFEEALANLRAHLPEELRQSRWVIKERDEMLQQATRVAEQMRADALVQQQRLVDETEILLVAQQEAERIVDEAREAARVLRLESEDYVDAKLANFEIVLNRTLTAVTKGRERLRGQRPVQYDLEVGQLGVDVVLRLQAQDARGLAGLIDDAFRLLLGHEQDLGLIDQPLLLDEGVRAHLLGHAGRLLEHLIALLDDPPGLAQLLGQMGAQVRQRLLELAPRDHDRGRQRYGAGLGEQLLELTDVGLGVHGWVRPSAACGCCVRLWMPDRCGPVAAACGARSLADEVLPQALHHHRGHEIGDVATEPGDLLHERGGEVGVYGAGGEEEGLDVADAVVHLRHLQLVLEVADGAQSLDDDANVVSATEVHQQPGEGLHGDVAQMSGDLLQQRDPLADGKHRLLALVLEATDDEMVIP